MQMMATALAEENCTDADTETDCDARATVIVKESSLTVEQIRLVKDADVVQF